MLNTRPIFLNLIWLTPAGACLRLTYLEFLVFDSEIVEILDVNRKQRTAALLHRESGQGDVAAAFAHLFQPFGSAAVQKLRTAGREDDVRHWRNGRIRPGIESILHLFLFILCLFVSFFLVFFGDLRRHYGALLFLSLCIIACAYRVVRVIVSVIVIFNVFPS